MADLRPILRQRRAADLTVDVLIDVVAEFGGAVADAVDKDYNLANARAARFLRDYASKRVGMINATTRDALNRALRADDKAAAIREVFRHAREVRAPMIAQSEVDRTSNFAAIDAGKWSAQLELKRWASQMDGRERPTHHAMHNQIVGWNEDFVSPSGAHGPAPGLMNSPEESIGCRCASLPAKRGVIGDSVADAVEIFNGLRDPFVEEMTAAWRRVFDEQEILTLAEFE